METTLGLAKLALSEGCKLDPALFCEELEVGVGGMIEGLRVMVGNTYIKDNYVRIHNPQKYLNSCVFGGLHHI